MINEFDSDNYPDAIPSELTAGSRWAWTRSNITSAYPTTLYTLKFRLSLLESPFTDFEIDASKVSSAHVVEISQASTTGYTSGEYSWSAVVVRDSDSEEIIVDRGFLSILPDMGASPGDTRSWIYQTLVDVRAALKESALKGYSSYAIGGRSMVLRSHEELIAMEKEFTKRWNNEKAEVERKAGRSVNSRVLVKMSA